MGETVIGLAGVGLLCTAADAIMKQDEGDEIRAKLGQGLEARGVCFNIELENY